MNWMNWGLNPGRSKVFLFVKTLRPALRRPNLIFNVYWFLTRQKAARLWSIPLTSIYCWGYEWLELYLYLPCMPVCVNSCWDILKHWKQQCMFKCLS